MIDLVKIISWCMWSILIFIFLVWLNNLRIAFCEACKKWWKGELSDEEKEKQKELDEWVEMETRTFKDNEEQ